MEPPPPPEPQAQPPAPSSVQYPNQQPLPPSPVTINHHHHQPLPPSPVISHQVQPQVMMCPVGVQYMYEPQMLVPAEEHVQPFQNQTFLINVQNPPPWSQNRPNMVYMQQMQMPSSIPQYIPQNMVPNPMFNYQYQPMMTQQDQLRQLMINQNLIQNSQNLVQSSQNLVQNQPALVQNSQSLLAPQNVIQNQQSLIQSPQSLVQTPQALVQNPQSIMQNSQNFAYNPQNFIQNSQTLVPTQSIVQSTPNIIQNSLRFPQVEQNKQMPILTQYMLQNPMMRKPAVNQDYITPMQIIRPQYIRQILTVKPMSSNHTCAHHNAQKEQNQVIPNETPEANETQQKTDIPPHLRNQILEGLNAKNFIKVSSKTAFVRPIDIGLPLQNIAPADEVHPRVDPSIYPKSVMKSIATNSETRTNKRKANDTDDQNAKAQAEVQAKRNCLNNYDKVRYQPTVIEAPVGMINVGTQINRQVQTMPDKTSKPPTEEKLLRNTVFVQARGRVNEKENAKFAAPIKNDVKLNSPAQSFCNGGVPDRLIITRIKIDNQKDDGKSAMETENVDNDSDPNKCLSKATVIIDNLDDVETQKASNETSSTDETLILNDKKTQENIIEKGSASEIKVDYIIETISKLPHTTNDPIEPTPKNKTDNNAAGNSENKNENITNEDNEIQGGTSDKTSYKTPVDIEPQEKNIERQQIENNNATKNDDNIALNNTRMLPLHLDRSQEFEITSASEAKVDYIIETISKLPHTTNDPIEPTPKNKTDNNAADNSENKNEKKEYPPKKRGRPRKSANEIQCQNNSYYDALDIMQDKYHAKISTQILEKIKQYSKTSEPKPVLKNAKNEDENKTIETTKNITIQTDPIKSIDLLNSKSKPTEVVKEITKTEISAITKDTTKEVIRNDPKLSTDLQNLQAQTIEIVKEIAQNKDCERKLNNLVNSLTEKTRETHKSICKMDATEKMEKFILTHVLDGHVIQESNVPFVVKKGSLSSTKTTTKNILEGNGPFFENNINETNNFLTNNCETEALNDVTQEANSSDKINVHETNNNKPNVKTKRTMHDVAEKNPEEAVATRSKRRLIDSKAKSAKIDEKTGINNETFSKNTNNDTNNQNHSNNSKKDGPILEPDNKKIRNEANIPNADNSRIITVSKKYINMSNNKRINEPTIVKTIETNNNIIVNQTINNTNTSHTNESTNKNVSDNNIMNIIHMNLIQAPTNNDLSTNNSNLNETVVNNLRTIKDSNNKNEIISINVNKIEPTNTNNVNETNQDISETSKNIIDTNNTSKLNVEMSIPEPETEEEYDPFEHIDKTTVKSWTITDVYSRLNHLNWRDSAKKLREEEIDGESLLLVSKEQLLQIGISENHADIIYDFVENCLSLQNDNDMELYDNDSFKKKQGNFKEISVVCRKKNIDSL